MYDLSQNEISLLIEIIKNNKKNYPKILKSKKYNWLYAKVLKNTKFLDDPFFKISTKIYCIVNNISSLPRCNECGKILKRNIQTFELGFGIPFCNTKCANKNTLIKEKIKQTCLERYGVENAMYSEEIKERLKSTCLERYGTEYYTNSDDFKIKSEQTCLERYNCKRYSSTDEYKEKIKQTCLERYGVEHYSKTEEYKLKLEEAFSKNKSIWEDRNKKSISTLQEKYGINITNPLHLSFVKEKIKQTCLERYGVDHYAKTEECKNKARNTCLKKYGVDSPMKVDEIRKKSQKRYTYNNIHFDSAPEIAYYIWLTDNNIDFQYQPEKSFQYLENNKIKSYFPDFYLISTNEYVEIKGDNFFKNGKPNYNNVYDWTAKYNCMIENNVKILRTKDYRVFIDYVIKKFNDKNYFARFKNSGLQNSF
jgi:hypothetical protein